MRGRVDGHVHRFRALTFDGVPVLGRWKCVCGLKVPDRATAEALDGTSV